MKPLIRWIIGPVFPAGFDCLKISYDNMRRIYGSSFDYVICYNQLTPQQMAPLDSTECELRRQYSNDFTVTPTRWPSDVGDVTGTRNCWKLHPPRLKMGVHEIILDNDIVIRDRMESVERFLEEDRPMLTEARARNYGAFDQKVPSGIQWNSGIIGLPPDFDFSSALRAEVSGDFQWKGFFDEQGVVAAVMAYRNPIIISQEELAICGPDDEMKGRNIHFIGLNSNHYHKAWNQFSGRRQPKLL